MSHNHNLLDKYLLGKFIYGLSGTATLIGSVIFLTWFFHLGIGWFWSIMIFVVIGIISVIVYRYLLSFATGSPRYDKRK